MRIVGDTKANVINAAKSKDLALLRNILFDAISDLIEKSPDQVISALQKSKVKISSNADIKTIINSVAYNIVNNRIFQKNISILIAFHNTGQKPTDEDFNGNWSNAEDGGEGSGNLVASISNAVGSIFNFASSTNELKSEETKAKSAMMVAIFGKEEKTNYIPIVILGGVLIIGAIVVWRVTAK